MFQTKVKWFSKVLRRYWIVIVVLSFGILSIYTSHPIYGAPAATPTPEVNTVPKPELVLTPTNTPFPMPTASSEESPATSGGGGAPSSPSGNTNSGNNPGNSSNSGSSNNSSGAGANATSGAPSTQPGSTQANGTGIPGVITAVTVNMRKGPSTTAHIIDTLFLNDPVEIVGRDNSGAWWYVCCGARTKLTGWVSKQLIRVDLSDEQADKVIPLFDSATTSVAVSTQGAGTGATGNSGTASPLVLEMRPAPAFAWQGQTLDLQFVLHNRSEQAIVNAQLRNDLPPELAMITAKVGSQGQFTYTGARQSGPILTINWPEVRANGQVTATVTVQIAADTADGALIDNLAIVNTVQGAQAVAGVTIAMPPVALPQFR